MRFQLGTGLIRPTQIVFVPMLFLTPAAAVPLLVTLGGVLGELPDLLRRRAHPERLAVVVADGWYAIGPAIAVALLDQQTTLAVLARSPSSPSSRATWRLVARVSTSAPASSPPSCCRCSRSST